MAGEEAHLPRPRRRRGRRRGGAAPPVLGRGERGVDAALRRGGARERPLHPRGGEPGDVGGGERAAPLDGQPRGAGLRTATTGTASTCGYGRPASWRWGWCASTMLHDDALRLHPARRHAGAGRADGAHPRRAPPRAHRGGRAPGGRDGGLPGAPPRLLRLRAVHEARPGRGDAAGGGAPSWCSTPPSPAPSTSRSPARASGWPASGRRARWVGPAARPWSACACSSAGWPGSGRRPCRWGRSSTNCSRAWWTTTAAICDAIGREILLGEAPAAPLPGLAQ